MTTRTRQKQAHCLCGCGVPVSPGRNFVQTHDGVLVRIIVRGSEEERARVDWLQVLEKGFSSRRYDGEIRQLISEAEPSGCPA